MLKFEDRTKKRQDDEPNPGLSPEDWRHYQSFEDKLQVIRDQTAGVALGYDTGLHIFGEGGTGKTFTVLQELKRLQAPHRLTNSRVTGRGLFDILAQYPDEVHVLDDVESLVNDKAALGVLRSGMWGQGGPRDRHGRQERLINWALHKNKLSVVFVGGIIMLGNCSLADIPELRALGTRIVSNQHTVSDREMMAMMRYIALRGYRFGDREMHASECTEVVEFVIKESLDRHLSLDMRLIENCYSDFLKYNEHDSGTHWKDLVRSRLRHRPTLTEAVVPVGARAAKKAWELKIAREIVGMPKDERFKVWHELTGMSMGTMYRRFEDLAREDSQFFYK